MDGNGNLIGAPRRKGRRMLPTDAKIISVDDHVIEHPRVWLDRLPQSTQTSLPASSGSTRAPGRATVAGKHSREGQIAPTSSPGATAGHPAQAHPSPTPPTTSAACPNAARPQCGPPQRHPPHVVHHPPQRHRPTFLGRAHLSISSDHTVHLLISFDHKIR
jgi:hypothetical protein